MLKISTVNTGADLAAVLTSQGVQISPKGTTPLAKLNHTLMGAGLGILTGLTKDQSEDKKDFDTGWMAMMVDHSQANLPDGSPSEYQAYMNVMADEIANSVSGTIDFSRNVVNPIIKDICEKIEKTLDAAGQGGDYVSTSSGQRFTLSNGALVVNIHEEGPIPLYMDASTEGETSARLQVPYRNIKSPVMFPEVSSVTLVELMENNAGSQFIKDVIEAIKAREDGYEFVCEIYNEVYRFQPGRPTGIDIQRLTNDLSLYPLIVLALSSVLYDELPDGTSGSAENIKNALGDWSTQVKNIISINVEVYKQSLAAKKIVTNSYTNNFVTEIYVNKENYQSFLEDGGTTESLLGSIFSDKDYDYDNLLSNQSKYESVYARRIAEAASFNEANRLTIFKNTLRDSVYSEIFDCDDQAIRPVIPAEAREQLDLLMKSVYVDALDCPYQTVRRVVCGSLFAGTDAEEILVNIDNICEKNENLSVRDASALVVLDYLTKYFVSQMDIKRTH